MSWVTKLAPYAQAAGGVLQAAGTIQGAKQNAADLEAQARTASQQGLADEEAQRRAARAELGKQAAALAQAGGGYGGTVAGVMADSHANAEIDALNIRYRGLNKAYTLRTQARRELQAAGPTAGAQLLSAATSAYGAYKANKL